MYVDKNDWKKKQKNKINRQKKYMCHWLLLDTTNWKNQK